MKTISAFRSGFTLIEIFLVILILSVLTGICLPRFSDSCKQLILKENADMFLSQIRYTRKLALLKGIPHYLLFTPESLEIRVGDTADMARNLSLYMEKYKFSPGLSVQSEPLCIAFHPEGDSDPFVFKIQNEENIITLSGNGNPDNLSKEEYSL